MFSSWIQTWSGQRCCARESALRWDWPLAWLQCVLWLSKVGSSGVPAPHHITRVMCPFFVRCEIRVRGILKLGSMQGARLSATIYDFFAPAIIEFTTLRGTCGTFALDRFYVLSLKLRSVTKFSSSQSVSCCVLFASWSVSFDLRAVSHSGLHLLLGSPVEIFRALCPWLAEF